jgi:hypothetical protein
LLEPYTIGGDIELNMTEDASSKKGSWLSKAKGSRFLNSFANAVLDVGLPKVRAWIQEKFGPHATIEQITMEGSQIRLRGVSLPLFGNITLSLEEAYIHLASMPTLNNAKPELRLFSMTGSLAVTTEKGQQFFAPISFQTSTKSIGSWWVDGTLQVNGATWVHTQGVGEQAPVQGNVQVQISSEQWRLFQGELKAGPATIHLEANGAMDNTEEQALAHASVRLEQTRIGHFLDAVIALSGIQLPPLLPAAWSCFLEGNLVWKANDGLSFALQPHTDNSNLTFKGTMSELLEISIPDIRGTIDLSELPLPDVALGYQKIVGNNRLPITAHVSGSWDELKIQGAVSRTLFALQGEWLSTSLTIQQTTFLINRSAELWRVSVQLEAQPTLLDISFAQQSTTTQQLTFAFQGVQHEMLLAFQVLMDRQQPWTLPRNLELCGTLSGTMEQGLSGSVDLVTPTSHLQLAPFVWKDGQSEGSLLHGQLGLQDATAMGWFDNNFYPQPQGSFEGELEIRGPWDAPWLAGDVRLREVALRWRDTPRIPALVLSDIAGKIRVDGQTLAYQDVTFKVCGGSCSGKGIVFFGPTPVMPPPALEIQFADIRPQFFDYLGHFFTNNVILESEKEGVRSPQAWWVPKRALLFGQLTLFPNLSMNAELGLETDSTALFSHLYLHANQRLDGSFLRGRVSLQDAKTIGLFSTDFRPITQGNANLNLKLTGEVSAPRLEGDIQADMIRLHLASNPSFPKYQLRDIHVTIQLDQQALRWNQARAIFYGGTIHSSGHRLLLEQGSHLESTFTFERIQVEHLSINGDHTRRLGEHLAGLLSGEFSVTGHGEGSEPNWQGQGNMELQPCDYRFLNQYQKKLHDVDLPALETYSQQPLRAHLTLDEKGLDITNIKAEIPQAQLVGQVQLGWNQAIRGNLTAMVNGSYLRRSLLLAVPTSFTGKLKVPIRLRGNFSNPIVDADFMGTLENSVIGLGRAVSDTVESLFGLFTGSPTTRSRQRDTQARDVDHDVVDRLLLAILDGHEDAGTCIAQLRSMGYSSDEIERMLERKRIRRRRYRV